MRIFTILPSAGKTIDQKGFSLLEILIALFLGTIILTLGLGLKFDSSGRDKMEESMDLIERAIRFGVDESVLRSRIVRLHFLLEEQPQQFTLEYASDENFVLSKKIVDWENEDDLDEDEKEEQRKLLEEINEQFQPVDEFQEESQPLPERVRIVGVATSAFERLIVGSEVSFFIYPTGEKDGALIILGNDEEMATLGIEEFTLDFKRSWIKNPPSLSEEDDDEEAEIPTPAQLKKSEELFKQWLSP